MKKATAQIYWITPEMGGRKKLPQPPSYSTVAKFADVPENSPGSWSIVFEFHAPADDSRTTRGEIRFLVPDAPHNLLYEGSLFKLYEGAKCVASGIVTSGIIERATEAGEVSLS